MKKEKFHWIKIFFICFGLFTVIICYAQDCDNKGKATVINYNYSTLNIDDKTSIELDGVVFSISVYWLQQTLSECNNNKCSDYSIVFKVTNINSYRVSVNLGQIQIGNKNIVNEMVNATGVIGLENKGMIPPGGTVQSINILCQSCGNLSTKCWCGSTPQYFSFRAAVTDMRTGDFENWRSSAEWYLNFKDNDPIAYLVCAKQHFQKALEYKDDSYCKEKIAEIDRFLQKSSQNNVPDNITNNYNQLMEDYNYKKQVINEYIESGDYENALKSLDELKVLASKAKTAPGDISAIEKKIKDLKISQLNSSKTKVASCPEGDRLLNEYESALNEYLKAMSESVNEVANSDDHIISYSQKLNAIVLQIGSLGCTLTDNQISRMDELIKKFANAATEITGKGMDNIEKDFNNTDKDNNTKGNIYPGAFEVAPQPKNKNSSTLKQDNLKKANLNTNPDTHYENPRR